MKILYFAWVRELAGLGNEEITPPEEIRDVASLVGWLRDRGGGPADALKDLTSIRVAVNQQYVTLSFPLGPNDEVAFFPPVTGG